MDRRYSPIVDMYGTAQSGASARRKSRIWLFVFLPLAALIVFESVHPTMRLRPALPPSFAGENYARDAKQQGLPNQQAQACWDYARNSLQGTYPYGTKLPYHPLPAINGKLGKASSTKELCWQKLRHAWTQPTTWVRSYKWSTEWATNPHSPFRKAAHNVLIQLDIAS